MCLDSNFIGSDTLYEIIHIIYLITSFLIRSQFQLPMHPDELNRERLLKIRAILFDLHHTITKTRVSMITLTKETAKDAGINLEHIADNVLAEAIKKTDQWARKYQVENSVDIHWGTRPEEWLEINRLFIRFVN